jgi:hypothetical protein
MTDTSDLTRLNLKRWPFALVPGEGADLVWADRAELRKRVSRVMRGLPRHHAATLHLLWADFGAGKTHTLRFIEQEATAGRFQGITPIYSALPKGCRYFLEIYRAVMRALGPGKLGEGYRLAAKKPEAQVVRDQWPDLWAAFKILALGNDTQKTIAWNWLTATVGLSRQELALISLHGRIGSTESAVLALDAVARLLSIAFGKRVLLMIDEFQRVETLRLADRNEINAGLHSFYNEARAGLSIILSFSFGVEENIKHFLNKELLDRADPVRLSIPRLTADEGVTFLRDVIVSASEDPSRPFVSDETIASVVAVVSEASQLTPRRLLKVMGHISNEAMADLEDAVISEVTPEYSRQIAASLPRDFLDDSEE